MNDLQEYIGERIVLDTNTDVLYLGKLVSVEKEYVGLENADVCWVNDLRSTREQYLMEAAKQGIRKNRTHVEVKNSVIISVSRLKDIIRF